MKTLFGMKLDVKLGGNYRQLDNNYYDVRGIDDDIMSDAYRVEVLGKKLLIASICDPDIDGGKTVHTYDSHQMAMSLFGFKRALTPQEALGLIMTSEKGRGGSGLDKLVDDMLSEEGEFTCSAASYDGSILNVYEYVDGLMWDEDMGKYRIPEGNDWYENRKSFEIGEVASLIDLHYLSVKCPEFIEYMFGREDGKIPRRLRAGVKKVYMNLVNDGVVRPIVIGEHGEVNIICTDGHYASRGVCELR